MNETNEAYAARMNDPATKAFAKPCDDIADKVVPRYKADPPLSCGGTVAKKWQAAWDGACLALGGNPEDYTWSPPIDATPPPGAP